MKTHVKALVVGGGAVGTAIAYHLAKAGWDTLLVERDELTSGSTWHAAGLLPLFNMSYTVGQLHKYSVDLYKRQGKMKTNMPEKAPPELEEPEGSAAEYFDRLAQEGPTLPFGESMRDTNPDIDQAEHF